MNSLSVIMVGRFPDTIDTMLREFFARIGRGIAAFFAGAALASTVLTACGVKGPLKLPETPAAAPGARPSDTPTAPAPSSPLEPAPQPPSTAP
jgi:predicted small lipoprotein YifL